MFYLRLWKIGLIRSTRSIAVVLYIKKAIYMILFSSRTQIKTKKNKKMHLHIIASGQNTHAPVRTHAAVRSHVPVRPLVLQFRRILQQRELRERRHRVAGRRWFVGDRVQLLARWRRWRRRVVVELAADRWRRCVAGGRVWRSESGLSGIDRMRRMP